MKKLLTIAFSVLAFLSVDAQDEIYMEDGSMIRGHVLDVGPVQVRYKEYMKEEGPTYVVNTVDVIVIRYENGEYKYLAPTMTEEELEGTDLQIEYGPRIINFSLLSVFGGTIQFSAEYLFFDRGRLGVRIPYFFGTDSESHIQPENTAWGTGLDLNYYPLGQNTWSYFVGPSFRYGMARYKGECVDVGIGIPQECELIQEPFYGLYINNGVRFTPIPNLSFSFNMGVGSRENVGRDPGDTNVIFSGNVGFRF